MKFLGSQLAYLMSDRAQRANLRGLLKYIGFLVALVTVYAVLFHVIKTTVEGEQHSWITGFYWTLVVMSTLGFGDITFTSDVGRVFEPGVFADAKWRVSPYYEIADGKPAAKSCVSSSRSSSRSL